MGREKKKILIMDDEEEILEILRIRLENEGFSVLTTPRGGEGLEMAESESPDLVVLDLLMPGIDGAEACRRLSSEEATRHVPVIVLSARAGEGREPAMEAGARAYVSKPYEWQALLGKIREILRD